MGKEDGTVIRGNSREVAHYGAFKSIQLAGVREGSVQSCSYKCMPLSVVCQGKTISPKSKILKACSQHHVMEVLYRERKKGTSAQLFFCKENSIKISCHTPWKSSG